MKYLRRFEDLSIEDLKSFLVKDKRNKYKGWQCRSNNYTNKEIKNIIQKLDEKYPWVLQSKI